MNNEPTVYVGNYERIIGRTVAVKVRAGFVWGTVQRYNFKSRSYLVRCDDGKTRVTPKVYV